jgi:hypothetical protein
VVVHMFPRGAHFVSGFVCAQSSRVTHVMVARMCVSMSGTATPSATTILSGFAHAYILIYVYGRNHPGSQGVEAEDSDITLQKMITALMMLAIIFMHAVTPRAHVRVYYAGRRGRGHENLFAQDCLYEDIDFFCA